MLLGLHIVCSCKMDPSEDTAVQDFLEILEEHRKNCERQGKYVEAEIAKNRLDELKLHEENRRRVRIKATKLHFQSCLSVNFIFIIGSDALSSNCRETWCGRGAHA